MSLRQVFWRTTVARAALVIAFSILWWLPASESRAADAPPTIDDIRAEAARGGYRLIDLEGLRAGLDGERGRLLLVDTRQDWEYRTGHIPHSIDFSFEPTRWSRLKNRWALRAALGLVDYLPADDFLACMQAAQVSR